MMTVVLVIGFASCEKDSSVSLSQMELYYNESKGLPETSIDSVKSFASKFGGYINSNPESSTSEFYDPTVENIRYAAAVFGYEYKIVETGFLLDTTWLPEIHMNF